MGAEGARLLCSISQAKGQGLSTKTVFTNTFILVAN